MTSIGGLAMIWLSVLAGIPMVSQRLDPRPILLVEVSFNLESDWRLPCKEEGPLESLLLGRAESNAWNLGGKASTVSILS